ncbi:MAG: hypothetical protein ACK5NT_11430 [Pyrinomonadaceae bacterium]
MSTIFKYPIFIFFSFFIFFTAVNAQTEKEEGTNIAAYALKGTGKVAVIVVGTGAKVAWGTTKLAAKDVAKPIVVKSAPMVGKFMLKSTGKVISTSFTKGIPIVKNAAIQYLRYKSPF